MTQAQCISCNTVSEVDFRSGYKQYCPDCFSSDCFLPVAVKRDDLGWVKDVQTTKTARDIRRSNYHTVKIGQEYKTLLHGLGDGFSLAIWGGPGMMKSTWCISFLNSLIVSNGNKGLYNSLEEGFGQTFADKLERCEIIDDRFWVSVMTNYEGLADYVKENDIGFVVIDSFSATSVSKVKSLIHFHQDTGVGLVVVLHSTKSSLPAGDNSLYHYVDVVLHSYEEHGKKMIASQKNRYGKLAWEEIL